MSGGTLPNESCRVVSPEVPVAEHVFCVSLLFDYDLAQKIRSRSPSSMDSSNTTHRDFFGVPLGQVGAPKTMDRIRSPKPHNTISLPQQDHIDWMFLQPLSTRLEMPLVNVKIISLFRLSGLVSHTYNHIVWLLLAHTIPIPI
jgi:hypothetical protein